MKSILSLFVCLLGLSALANARHLKGSVPKAPQCLLSFYGPTPDPVCNTYTDENGQEQKACSAVGPAVSVAIVDKSAKTFKEADGSLYELNFSGDCDCRLVLYTKTDYKGQTKNYNFKNADDKVIFANQIWNRDNVSYKILCNF